MPTYIPNDRLERLAQALTQIQPCGMTGRITENEIKIALGQFGDIWPASIRPEGEGVVLRLIE